MIKIGVSRKIPTAAISVDRTMKIMKLAVRVINSEAELLDLFPHNGIGRIAGSRALSRFGRPREQHVELLDRDRSALRDAELLKIGEHDACRLPSHVAEEHVALRAHTGTAQHDDVACTRCLLEHAQCPRRQIGWHVDPQMDHGGDDRRGAGGRPRSAAAHRSGPRQLSLGSLQQDDQQDDDQEQCSESYVHSLTSLRHFHTRGNGGENGPGPFGSPRSPAQPGAEGAGQLIAPEYDDDLPGHPAPAPERPGRLEGHDAAPLAPGPFRGPEPPVADAEPGGFGAPPAIAAVADRAAASVAGDADHDRVLLVAQDRPALARVAPALDRVGGQREGGPDYRGAQRSTRCPI